MINMILCPNCRTIQREGTVCPLCSCPVTRKLTLQKRPPPTLEDQARKQHGFPSPYGTKTLAVAAPAH